MIRQFAYAAVLATAPMLAHAATITNGSFEDPLVPIPATFDTIVNGNSAIPGWTVFGNSVDWIGDYWESAEGDRNIDLNGSGGGDQKGGVKQLVTGLTAGVKYVISFALSGNPDGLPTTKSLTLVMGDDVGNFTYDLVANGTTRPSPMNWVYKTFTFVAGSTSEELAFISDDAGLFGAAIDDVTIAPIPVPAAFPLLLAGLGGLALLRRRRTV